MQLRLPHQTPEIHWDLTKSMEGRTRVTRVTRVTIPYSAAKSEHSEQRHLPMSCPSHETLSRLTHGTLNICQ